MILEVFSNLNDSMILFYESAGFTRARGEGVERSTGKQQQAAKRNGQQPRPGRL